MPSYQVQTVIKTDSGVPADWATNSWSFNATADVDMEDALDALEDFYNAIRASYSSNVEQFNHEFKVYDRNDPEPRAPIIERTWQFTTAPSGNPLPHEVSITMSFQGLRTSGVPQARRRGRIYIGPLNEGVVASTGRPSGVDIGNITTAGAALITASTAASGWTWTVWSTVNQVDVPIANGWVDNSFDTQRRRGRAATSRTTF